MLNDDILYLIFQYFDAMTLINCSMVNNQWRAIAGYDGLWKKLCNEYHEYVNKSEKKTWFETYKNCELTVLAKYLHWDAGNIWRRMVPLERRRLATITSLTRTKPIDMPKQIGQLFKLQEMHWNSGLTTLPREISLLRNLRILDLSNNKIVSIPTEIAQLSSLYELNLSKNQLTSIPKEIYTLTNLHILILSYNQLTSITNEIAQLINLRRLILSHNLLTSISPEIHCLANLGILNLAFNKLTEIPHNIYRMISLKNTTHDSTITIPPELFLEIPNLKINNRYIRRIEKTGETKVMLVEVTKK